MIFEGAGNQPHPRGEQCGSQCVAGKTRVALAVEREGEGQIAADGSLALLRRWLLTSAVPSLQAAPQESRESAYSD